jgi:hypothetical protein
MQRSLILLALAACAGSKSSATTPSSDLALHVVVEDDEHSKDSSSTRTIYELANGKLTVDVVPDKHEGRDPEHHTVSLSATQVAQLEAIVKAQALTESASSDLDKSQLGYAVTVDASVSLGGKTGTLHTAGMANVFGGDGDAHPALVTDDKVYQRLQPLIDALEMLKPPK